MVAVAPLPEAEPLDTPEVVAFLALPVESVRVVPLQFAASYFAHGGLLTKRVWNAVEEVETNPPLLRPLTLFNRCITIRYATKLITNTHY